MQPFGARARPLLLIIKARDDAFALHTLALSAMGFDVVPLSDSQDGYARACTTHPDLIMTEISTLPRIDAWALVRNLKRNERTRDIPVVLLSSTAEQTVCERAERKGCAAIFLKPCLPGQMALGLREILERQVGHEHAAPRA
jgi:two-component system phosphate regulon response regulator PhoB